jgi:hypothetical protein
MRRQPVVVLADVRRHCARRTRRIAPAALRDELRRQKDEGSGFVLDDAMLAAVTATCDAWSDRSDGGPVDQYLWGDLKRALVRHDTRLYRPDGGPDGDIGPIVLGL